MVGFMYYKYKCKQMGNFLWVLNVINCILTTNTNYSDTNRKVVNSEQQGI